MECLVRRIRQHCENNLKILFVMLFSLVRYNISKIHFPEVLNNEICLLLVYHLADETSRTSEKNKWTCTCSIAQQANMNFVLANCSSSCDCRPGIIYPITLSPIQIVIAIFLSNKFTQSVKISIIHQYLNLSYQVFMCSR